MNKTTATICRFLIKDGICQYGCLDRIMADRGELDAHEIAELFNRLEVNLALTKTYNPEANRKFERGCGPIVMSIVCDCNGHVQNWPRLLSYTLWVVRTTHNSVTG